MKSKAKSNNISEKYPLLMRGSDWKRRIPPKDDNRMTGTIYMTNNDWLEYYNRNRKRFGNNILDWPKHQRDIVRRIKLVKVVSVELKQATLPYGNTGVDTGV